MELKPETKKILADAKAFRAANKMPTAADRRALREGKSVPATPWWMWLIVVALLFMAWPAAIVLSLFLIFRNNRST